MTGLRILFVKEAQNWPKASGNDVHGFHLMKALAARGHTISLATIVPPSPQALDGLSIIASSARYFRRRPTSAHSLAAAIRELLWST